MGKCERTRVHPCHPIAVHGQYTNPIQLLTYNMVGQLRIWPCVLVVIVVWEVYNHQAYNNKLGMGMHGLSHGQMSNCPTMFYVSN